MPLELRSATQEDALRAAEIEALAFAPSAFNSVLFPGPFPPDANEARAAELIQQLREDATMRWLKVVDTDLEGEPMVSFAKWHVYPEKPPPARPRTFGPGSNPQACEMLFGGIDKLRSRLMGERPYVYLKLLQTDPKHQGRGAGAMLVKWGVEEAKRLGLPAFLESSEEGHSLYQKCGFRDLELQSLDFSKWGATKKLNTWAMIYEP
ncbi:hypothetical protein DL771_002004 [Monosporascus sp. 5C6A]|nr:hypothetical protein DL771_002004 [Monosporascus sp. 5C6A]